jgi:hypothetical protein
MSEPVQIRRREKGDAPTDPDVRTVGHAAARDHDVGPKLHACTSTLAPGAMQLCEACLVVATERVKAGSRKVLTTLHLGPAVARDRELRLGLRRGLRDHCVRYMFSFGAVRIDVSK